MTSGEVVVVGRHEMGRQFRTSAVFPLLGWVDYLKKSKSAGQQAGFRQVALLHCSGRKIEPASEAEKGRCRAYGANFQTSHVPFLTCKSYLRKTEREGKEIILRNNRI